MSFPRVLRAGVWAAAAVLAAISAQAASNMSYGVTVGTTLPAEASTVRVGRDTFYFYNGSFYRQVKNGFVLVPAPVGATVRQLPRGATTQFKVGKTTYYRHANVYFQAAGRSFKVCEAPPGAPAPSEEEKDATLTVRHGDAVYVFVAGRFYLRSPDGLLGRAIPIGAIAKDFPREAISVWFQNSEFFEDNGVFFRETKDGFVVVPPPWKRLPIGNEEALASASDT